VQSLLAENTSPGANGAGGGLYVAGGDVRLVNSTVSGNVSEVGTGVVVASDGRLRLESSTVAYNDYSPITAGVVSNAASPDQLVLQNSILANSSGSGGGPALSGPALSEGHNLIETYLGVVPVTPQPGDIFVRDAIVGLLANNGGPTRTITLFATSEAAGAGQTTLAVDQRGYARTGTPSIGAFEFGGVPVAGETGPVVGTAPGAFALSVAVPNPFRASTSLRFTTATADPVEVALYDALGRRVQTLYSGAPGPSADTEVRVDGAALPPGVYVVRVSSGVSSATQRLTVVR
jgi:hypothetical protein